MLEYFPDPATADKFHRRNVCKERICRGPNLQTVSAEFQHQALAVSVLLSPPQYLLWNFLLLVHDSRMHWPTWPNLPRHKGFTAVFTYSTVIPPGKISGRAGVRGYPNHFQSPAPAIVQHFHQVNNTARVEGSQEEKSLRVICHQNVNDLFNNTVKQHTLASAAHQR